MFERDPTMGPIPRGAGRGTRRHDGRPSSRVRSGLSLQCRPFRSALISPQLGPTPAAPPRAIRPLSPRACGLLHDGETEDVLSVVHGVAGPDVLQVPGGVRVGRHAVPAHRLDGGLGVLDGLLEDERLRREGAFGGVGGLRLDRVGNVLDYPTRGAGVGFAYPLAASRQLGVRRWAVPSFPIARRTRARS